MPIRSFKREKWFEKSTPHSYLLSPFSLLPSFFSTFFLLLLLSFYSFEGSDQYVWMSFPKKRKVRERKRYCSWVSGPLLLLRWRVGWWYITTESLTSYQLCFVEETLPMINLKRGRKSKNEPGREPGNDPSPGQAIRPVVETVWKSSRSLSPGLECGLLNKAWES